MTILEDTKQKVGKHKNISDWCSKNGVEIIRWSLIAGDYTLPTNQTVSIDTKYGLKEISQNICTNDMLRFKREVLRAKSLGIRLIFLIEEHGIESVYDVINWSNPPLAKWQKIKKAQAEGKMLNVKPSSHVPPSNATIVQKMNELTRIHNVEWQFCDKSETGKRIVEILSGKERMERGDAD